MSQFISDSQTSPLGGLFSLKASNGVGGEVLSGSGFKLALHDVESSTGLQRQPLGLAVAATALPLGKELPPELQVLGEDLLSNVELEQLNFAAQAMGLKLAQVLQDKFAIEIPQDHPTSDQEVLLHGEQISTGDSDVAEQEVVEVLNPVLTTDDGFNLPNPNLIDKSESDVPQVSVESAIVVASNLAEHSTPVMAKQAAINTMSEEVEDDVLHKGEPITPQSTSQIPPKSADFEEIIPAFLSQWLGSDIQIVHPGESDSESAMIESTTLAALIDDNPDPANWHAIKILVPDDQSPVVGDIPARETSLLQLAKQLAQETASSDDFINALAGRTRQPEALAQQLLRHFTSQMKSEMEASD